MALTRKSLSAMGIEGDKIDEIISLHAETVAALNEKIDAANDKAEKAQVELAKAAGVAEELATLKAQVAKEAKEREGKDYEKLKKEFDDYKAEVSRQAVRSQKEAAYKGILKDAGVPEKYHAKILKYSDVDGVELDDKGNIKTAKDILKAIKEEWADHIETTSTQGAPTPTPPGNNGGGVKMTLEQIDAIKDTTERQKAMLDNHELYGI